MRTSIIFSMIAPLPWDRQNRWEAHAHRRAKTKYNVRNCWEVTFATETCWKNTICVARHSPQSSLVASARLWLLARLSRRSSLASVVARRCGSVVARRSGSVVTLRCGSLAGSLTSLLAPPSPPLLTPPSPPPLVPPSALSSFLPRLALSHVHRSQAWIFPHVRIRAFRNGNQKYPCKHVMLPAWWK